MDIQDVLATFVHGVYIIGAKQGDKVNGMSVAWVSQCSFSPKMVSVAISPERFTYELIEGTGRFSVCLLSKEQIDIAKKFGLSSGRNLDKFQGVDYELVEGVPVLTDCLSWLVCRVEGKMEVGDHYLFAGRIIKARRVKEGDPLVFHWEDYF